MKTTLFAFFAATLLGFSSCLKDQEACVPKTPSSEESAMQSYANANGITATKHSSGLFYQVTNPGTGAVPSLANTVSVTYTGKLLDGTTFESRTTPLNLALNQVITGWQIGLQQIKKGGSIKLIIPSSMAYGCAAVGSIPPNSILYFEVNLIDVI
ncbi:MAG: hypothetical protein RJA57_103 [Bacteroidota bacterium]|jgi:FKBP-type peptidyl-prolyl cis-trans isomerase